MVHINYQQRESNVILYNQYAWVLTNLNNPSFFYYFIHAATHHTR